MSQFQQYQAHPPTPERQTRSPRRSNAAAAARVAATIGAFKWVLIAAQVVAGIVLLLALNSVESWPTWTAASGLVALLFMLLSAVMTWVLFGWFQHTLGMLAAISANTSAP
jgi:hypothetical protein